MASVFREIEADDIPALFFVRTRTRQNSYTLTELHELGITPASVRERLDTSNKGWLCTVDDTVAGVTRKSRTVSAGWNCGCRRAPPGRHRIV